MSKHIIEQGLSREEQEFANIFGNVVPEKRKGSELFHATFKDYDIYILEDKNAPISDNAYTLEFRYSSLNPLEAAKKFLQLAIAQKNAGRLFFISKDKSAFQNRHNVYKPFDNVRVKDLRDAGFKPLFIPNIPQKIIKTGLNGAQKKLAKIFGGVAVKKMDNGRYLARCANGDMAAAHDGCAYEMIETGRTEIRAAKNLLRTIGQHQNSNDTFYILEGGGYIKDGLFPFAQDLENYGFKPMTVPKLNRK